MKLNQVFCLLIALGGNVSVIYGEKPLDLQVIESQEVDLGNRSIIFNLVEPPVLAEPVVETPAVEQLSATAQAAMEARAAKKQVMLEFSATVYDQQFTELRWTHKGQEYRAFSNIDFNHLRVVEQFETTDTAFTLVLGIGDESTQGMTALDRAKLPLLSQFNTTKAEFKLPKEGPGVTAEAIEGLTALHRYYAANKQTIVDAFNAEQTKQAQYTQWLKEHPPVAKDTVINFWPEQNNYFEKVGIVEGAAQ